jgi:hypothetical protein
MNIEIDKENSKELQYRSQMVLSSVRWPSEKPGDQIPDPRSPMPKQEKRWACKLISEPTDPHCRTCRRERMSGVR